ncbi:MAG: PAS domain S-box protein [Candidatus Omnitrophota bacterium]
MIAVYFAYGLAFILMGIIIAFMPKRSDFLDLGDHLWLVAAFGFIHGTNEWIEMFILMGMPFDINTLKLLNNVSLPISYLFLVLFGSIILCREKSKFCILRYAWAVSILCWSLTYVFSKDFLIAGIAARYFICVPGTLMSAIAIFVCARRIEKDNDAPNTVFYGAVLAVMGFVLYGILSGMVVPDAKFLPACYINYSNFLRVFGLPVQVLRMFVAMIISIGVFGMAGLFSRSGKIIKFRGGIRRKISLMVSGTALFLMTIGIAVGYSGSIGLFRETVVRTQGDIAGLAAIATSELLNKEIKQVEGANTRPLWIRAIAKENEKYSGIKSEAIESYMMDMDKKWIPAAKDDSLITKYTDNEVGNAMKSVVSESTNTKEVFITDMFGGLVAASDKTSDFYQADETWWQKTFNNGIGQFYISSPELDESTGSLSVSFNTPMRNASGEVIGVCKFVEDLSAFFSPIGSFKIGRTGQIALVDDKGRIIFYADAKPLSLMICSEADVKKLFLAGKRHIVSSTTPFVKGSAFLVYANVTHPLLSKIGIDWKLVVVQDAEEVFAPVFVLVFQAIVVLLVLLCLIFPLGYILGKRFVRPIAELRKGTEIIAKGNLDYRADVKSSDEIGELADSFNFMAANLKKITASRDELNREIAERQRVEEEVEKLAMIVKTAEDAIYSTVDGIVVAWNRGAEKIYGYSESEIKGKHVSILAPAGRKYEVSDALERIKRGERVERFETIRIRKDGRPIYVSLSVSPFYDKNGKVVGASSIASDITRQKKIEEALKASEVKYKVIYDSSADAIMTLTKNGRFFSANPSAVKMFGCRDEAELVNNDVSGFSPEYQPDGTRSDQKSEEMVRAAIDKGSNSFEWTHRRMDGTIFYATVLLTKMELQGAEMLQATVRDITEKKKIEEALRTSEENYRTLVENVNLGVFRATGGAHGRFIRANFAVAKLLGYDSLEELSTIPVSSHYANPVERALFVKDLSVEKSIKGREIVLKRKDGSTFWVSVNAVAHFDANGNIEWIDTIVEDITERKHAQEQLKDAAEEWQRTFDSMSDVIFIMDTNSTIIKVNKTFTEKFGEKLGNVIGKKCYEVMHKGSAHWPSCPLAATQSTGKSKTEEVDDPNIGIPLLVTTSPLLDAKGKMTGVVHVAKDITELKKAEKEIAAAMDMKEQFISIASHELRAPMAIIKESVEIINDELAGKVAAPIRKIIDVAKRNVERLVRLSNDILDLQKLEAGKVDFDMQVQDINEVIKEVAAGVSVLIKDKGLEFSLSLSDDIPAIKFDKDKIVQVLTNLINNALKFTDRGGIKITSAREAGGVVVSIIDTGPGIKKEDMAKLFQKFQQVGSASERKGGTGLGLAICKEIIERHNGRIWTESELGAWTKFSFFLPS